MERERRTTRVSFVKRRKKSLPEPTFKRWLCTIWNNGFVKVFDEAIKQAIQLSNKTDWLRKVFMLLVIIGQLAQRTRRSLINEFSRMKMTDYSIQVGDFRCRYSKVIVVVVI